MSSPIRAELAHARVPAEAAFETPSDTAVWTPWRVGAVVALGAVLGAGMVLAVAPTPAGAEAGDAGILSFIRSERGARAAPAAYTTVIHPAVRAYAPAPGANDRLPSAIRTGRIGDDPTLGAAARKARPGAEARKTADLPAVTGGSNLFCVRSCDGHFFPLGHRATGDGPSADALCRSACPGAEVRAFSPAAGTPDIGRALAESRFAAIIAAAARRRDATCTCTPAGARARIAMHRDFTLRAGDVVIGDQTALVFRGSDSWPYRKSDFAVFNAVASPLAADQRRDIDRIVGASHFAKAMQPYSYARRAPAKPVTLRPRAAEALPAPASNRVVEVIGAAPGPASAAARVVHLPSSIVTR